jgi:ketosteroid isomerase-like protein
MDPLAKHIIALEEAALTRWGKGDPSGYLEITAPDVVYFDPYIPERVDGVNKLEEYYRKALWGQVFYDRFELLNPCVQVCNDVAVLTFNYASYKDGLPDRWNCTEVYRRSPDGMWRIIQSHWSYTEVFKNKVNQ